MIKKLSLENFKGHKELDVDLGRITILIGPNGTGKSSILQALMVIRQSIGQGSLVTSGPLVNLGEFNDVKNMESTEGDLGIGLEIGIKKYPIVGLGENSIYSCMTYWSPQLNMFDIEIRDSEKNLIKMEYDRKSGILNVVPKNISPKEYPTNEIQIIFDMGGNFYSPLKISSVHVPHDKDDKELNKISSDFQTEITGLLSEFEHSIRHIYYVPAIRGVDQPYYNLSDQYVLDLLPIQNMQLATTFAYASDHIKEMVETWSNEITGSEISVNVVPGKRVSIKSSVVGGIPIIGDGFGANQLVQLLLMLAATPQNSMLAIEEPEIHLHPKAQSKLVDILVGIVKNSGKQLIFTTHSEHMMYGCLNAVRDGRLSNKEVAIYYFEEKGSKPIYNEIDEGGDIYEWGKHFFSID